MAVKNWTPAQKAAIEDEGGALLVSAAAGSGKTAVLVERAVRLITRAENLLRADRILIVTFTNAAAEELRSRIGAAIESELAARPHDRTLRRQRIFLRRAAICTIDAFCQQLVKENFARLDIPPEIAVGEAALLEQLSADALFETMEEMYAQPAFCDFAALYGRARSDKAAQEAIINLYEFTRTLPQPRRHLQNFAQAYTNEIPMAETPWVEELLAYAQSALEAAARLCQNALQTAGEEEALEGYLPMLREDLSNVQALLAAVLKKEWDTCVQLLAVWKFAPLKAVRGYEGYGKERVKKLRDAVKDIKSQLEKYCFVCTQEEFAQDRQQAAPLVGALTDAVLLYEQKYYAAKLEQRVLDFSDFEHLALALLQTQDGGRTPAADAVSSRYDIVMVDEYQDTNELQSALYECLANQQKSNLFYVGDVKQSIYRFRKANPGIFLQKKREWFPHASGRHPAVLTLGHNFRSGKGVIGGVNYVCGMLMSETLGEVAYTSEEKLIQGAEGGDPDGFELCVLQDENGYGDAPYVAMRIKEMVRQEYLVREDGVLRPCNYGDFCILLRARSNMQAYVNALEMQGIPVMGDSGDELLQTPEVLPVCAALAAIDNPGDDISLAALMLGPLFSFSMDDITRLRAENPKGSLWGAVAASKSKEAGGFAGQIAFYRALAGQVPVGRLCRELVEGTGYLSAVSAMEGGAARRENLLRFIAWAGEVSTAGRGGLPGFVRLLQNGRGPAAAAGGVLPGHVRVLTIHKSKGLEFPVCILADAARGFNTRDLVEKVQLHAELGVGLKLRQGGTLFATLPALAIRRRGEREALSEEMRVLYVALTRAKDKFLCVFAHKKAPEYLAERAASLASGPPDAFMLSREKSFAGWLINAALCHPQAAPFLEHTGGVIPPCANTQSRFVMRFEQAPALQQAEKETYRLTAPPDEALAKSLMQYFNVETPRAALQKVPVKMSVSALAKPAGTPVLRKRPSFMYGGGLTAAERGTAQHSFMQFADYTRAAQNLETEIKRLAEEGFIRPEMAEKLDFEGIKAFLASPLAARMQKAGTLLREYDFITALPAEKAGFALPAQLQAETVMVQGIADAVLIQNKQAEIVDYKTDRDITPQELSSRYQKQLALYAQAIAKKLGLPVVKLTIWSFSLSCEVDVPL